MDIIFDTNILRGHPLLMSRNFKRLKMYVIRTKSAIVLPRIVLEELQAVYGRELIQRCAVARKAVRELNQLLPVQFRDRILWLTIINYLKRGDGT